MPGKNFLSFGLWKNINYGITKMFFLGGTLEIDM